METLGLTIEEFNELAVSTPGRADIRRRFVHALREADAADEFLRSLASDSASCLDTGREQHALIVAAVLAGAVPAPLPAHQLIWNMGIKACSRLPGFERLWIAALDESGGWPVFPEGMQSLHRWLEGTIEEKNRAIDWLAGLRWHACAPRVADAVRRDNGTNCHRHSEFAARCQSLLDSWTVRAMESLLLANQPPRLVGHYVRSILSFWTGWPRPEMALARFQNDPRFVAVVKRELAKLRKHPFYLHALEYLAHLAMPSIETEMVAELKSREPASNVRSWGSATLSEYLLLRAPSTLLDMLEETPRRARGLAGSWSDKPSVALQSLPEIHLRRLARVMKDSGGTEFAARLGDKSVLPELKLLERANRTTEIRYFHALGCLVYLCDWPDDEVRNTLLWRVDAGRQAAEALRLLAIVGEPGLLWERAHERNEQGELRVTPEDIFALALAARKCPEMSEGVSRFLEEAALGNPLAICGVSENLQKAALIGLVVLNTPDVTERLRTILLRSGPLSVRLLAAEGLERLGALVPEKALLPLWRNVHRHEFYPQIFSGIELYDEDMLRRFVCGMNSINFNRDYVGGIWRDLEDAGHEKVLGPERYRTFTSPHFLSLIGLPETNPDYDDRVRELRSYTVNAYHIGTFIVHEWSNEKRLSKELVRLVVHLSGFEEADSTVDSYIRFALKHRIYDPQFVSLAERHLATANQSLYDACVEYLNSPWALNSTCE